MDLKIATRKARYGHRDWLYWSDSVGNKYYKPMSVSSIEEAIKVTDGNFTLIAANSGHLHKINRDIAQIMLSNAKLGVL